MRAKELKVGGYEGRLIVWSAGNKTPVVCVTQMEKSLQFHEFVTWRDLSFFMRFEWQNAIVCLVLTDWVLPSLCIIAVALVVTAKP